MAKFSRELDLLSLQAVRPFLVLAYAPVVATAIAAAIAGVDDLSPPALVVGITTLGIVLGLGVQDDLRIRVGRVEAFTPTRAQLQLTLAFVAFVAFTVAIHDTLGILRPVLVGVVAVAALVGNRTLIAMVWGESVIAIFVAGALVGLPGNVVVAFTISYGSAFGALAVSVHLLNDLFLRSAGRAVALGELAAAAADQRSLVAGVGDLLALAATATDAVGGALLLVSGNDMSSATQVAQFGVPIESMDKILASGPIAAGSWVESGKAVLFAASPSESQQVVLVLVATPVGLDHAAASTAAAVLQSMTERISRSESLQELALTDELTGMPNRREMYARLDEAIQLAGRDGSSLSLVFFDLDHFKDFNDHHGHLVGDQALKVFATLLQTRFRGQDTVARFGGEEFCAVLPDTTVESAVGYVERLRLGGIPPVDGDTLTFSAGAAQWNGKESRDSLLQRADEALYLAKRSGRDRVERAADH